MTQKRLNRLLAWLIALMAVCATFTGCEGYFSKTRLDEPEQTEQSSSVEQLPSEESNPDAGVM